VSLLWTALFVCAVLVLAAAEWPRVSSVLGADRRRSRERARRKKALRVIENDPDDFAASVERDLEALPTIEERDRGKPR
jgi:cytochrome c-type biogenesis protein CcmH/NrfG